MPDIEKLLCEANEGDVGAMLELTRHYMCVEYSYVDAVKWADAAADTGHANGCMLSAHLHCLTAEANKALGNIDGMKEESQIAYDRAILISDALKQNRLQWNEQMKNQFYDRWRKIRYILALSIYYQGDSLDMVDLEQVVSILEGVPSAQAGFLRGICVIRKEKYQEAFSSLLDAYEDTNYANAVKEPLEEGIYSEGIRELSLLYRIEKSDLNKAVEVLNHGIATVKDADFRKPLQDELNHYSKKLFGGYRYV